MDSKDETARQPWHPNHAASEVPPSSAAAWPPNPLIQISHRS